MNDMITKNDAAKFWAKYFNADEEEALECHHMTIDCMVKFAQEQVKNCSIPDVVGQSEQLVCDLYDELGCAISGENNENCKHCKYSRKAN